MKILKTKFKGLKIVYGITYYDNRGFFREIYRSQYFRNLFLLSSGVGFSQLIPLLLLPILTRFFSVNTR